jgi:outer membrane lipoprotein-sorting protein
MSLLLILFQNLSAQTLTKDQILKNMEDANLKYPSLQGTIQKTKHTVGFSDDDDISSGKFWILRSGNTPRQIKIDIDKPAKEFFLIEKGSFKHYRPLAKDAEVKEGMTKDTQAELECVFLGLCQSTAVITQYYDVNVLGQELVNGTKTTLLELKPKDKKHPSGIGSIRLWMDSAKWIPVQTRVFETTGTYLNALYSNISTEKFGTSVFKLDIPSKDTNITKLK